jgi:pimeloyl-ACP methyl ester carboxylesterase
VTVLTILLSLTFRGDTARSYLVPLAKAESLWVTESGTGQPVVLIPGLFGSAYTFRRVVPLLAEKGYRAIVIEPLGIGYSGRPERANYSLTAQSERVADVLTRLQAGNAVVIGHSVGSSVALRLAYRHPELVRALLSIEGGAAESVMTPNAKAAMRFIPWVKWLGGMKLIRGKIRKGLIESSADPSWVTDEVVQGYTAGDAVNIDVTLKSLLAMSQAKEPEKLRPHLSEIHAPVRLLIGSSSKGGIPAEELRILQGSLQSLVVDTVPGVGLWIQEERPAAIVDAVGYLTPVPSPLRERGTIRGP